MKHNTIHHVIELVGSQRKLAELIGVTQQAVSVWRRKKQGIPAERALVLERATKGKVPRWLSRPDLWDEPSARR